MMRFLNREEAGHFLAHAARAHAAPGAIVLAILPGGVPVAREVARILGAPLEAFAAARVPAPGHPHLAIGGVAEGGAHHLDVGLARMLQITPAAVGRALARAGDEVIALAVRCRKGRFLPDLRGRTVFVVDDGVATGATMRAAIRGLRDLGAGRIVLAVPVGARAVLARLQPTVEAVVCLWQPTELHSVAEWYQDFAAPTEEEIAGWLEEGRPSAGPREEQPAGLGGEAEQAAC